MRPVSPCYQSQAKTSQEKKNTYQYSSLIQIKNFQKSTRQLNPKHMNKKKRIQTNKLRPSRLHSEMQG